MQRYVITNAQGLVLNTTQWDGVSSWSPGAGLTAVQHDTAQIGDTLVGGILTVAIPVDPVPGLRALAVTLLGSTNPEDKLLRAALFVLLDYINTVRGLLPVPLGGISPATFKNDIITKINSGAAD